jgi:hypothetical protein
MPELAAYAATAIVSAMGFTGTTVASAVATVAIEAAILVAGTAALNALTAPEVAANEGRPTDWSADPNAPIPFVMGRRALGGQIVYRDTFGPDNRYQGIVTVYSGAGPVNAMGTLLLDGVAQTFTGETMDSTPINKLFRKTRLGAQPDTVLTTPSVPGSHTLTTWTSAHKLSGKACSMIVLFQDGELRRWPTGEPAALQVVEGIKLWDPRLDSTWPGGSGSCRLATRSTWVYSTNPILHALNWSLGLKENSKLVGGIGSSVDGIDVASFISAANIADTNSWTVSAVAYSLEDKYQVLQGLLQAGGAIPARNAGKISCVSRAAAPASILTISAADTAGPVEFQVGVPREGRVNTITARCVQEDQAWELVDLEPQTSSTYVTEDGGERSRGVTYPYVSDKDQAAQLARYDIADSRESITGTIPLKPYLRELEPGDCFTITEDGFAMSAQKCMVLSRTYDPASDVVQVTFRSETNAKHAWALSGTGTAPPTPGLSGTDPGVVQTPDSSDWTATASTAGVPSITITGAVPESVNIARVVIEYRLDGGTDWTIWTEGGADTVAAEIQGLTANTAYEVAVSYRSVNGTLGARLVLSPVTTNYVDGQGVEDDTIDTAQVNTGAVSAVSVGTEAGPITSPNKNSGSPRFNTLKSHSFTVTEGEALLFRFTAKVDFASNNGLYWWAKLSDASPTWSASYDMTNADGDARYQHDSSTFDCPVLTFVIRNVTPGSYTIDWFINEAGSTAHIHTDAVVEVVELKKAGG